MIFIVIYDGVMEEISFESVLNSIQDYWQVKVIIYWMSSFSLLIVLSVRFVDQWIIILKKKYLWLCDYVYES